MTTPNTTGPSDEIQRYHHSRAVDDVFASKNGKYVLHSDHLAALSRAREESRREALEEAAQVCHAIRDKLAVEDRDEEGRVCAMYHTEGSATAEDCEGAIRALMPYTPQGETKEES